MSTCAFAAPVGASAPSVEPNRHKRRRAEKAAKIGLPLQAYTVDEYCVVFRTTPSTLYRQWAAGGGPPRYKDGHNTRIPVSGALEYQRRLIERGASS
jgi:hypothetical protein